MEGSALPRRYATSLPPIAPTARRPCCARSSAAVSLSPRRAQHDGSPQGDGGRLVAKQRGGRSPHTTVTPGVVGRRPTRAGRNRRARSGHRWVEGRARRFTQSSENVRQLGALAFVEDRAKVVEECSFVARMRGVGGLEALVGIGQRWTVRPRCSMRMRREVRQSGQRTAHGIVGALEPIHGAGFRRDVLSEEGERDPPLRSRNARAARRGARRAAR